MAARTSCSARLASSDGLAATGSVPSLPPPRGAVARDGDISHRNSFGLSRRHRGRIAAGMSG